MPADCSTSKALCSAQDSSAPPLASISVLPPLPTADLQRSVTIPRPTMGVKRFSSGSSAAQDQAPKSLPQQHDSQPPESLIRMTMLPFYGRKRSSDCLLCKSFEVIDIMDLVFLFVIFTHPDSSPINYRAVPKIEDVLNDIATTSQTQESQGDFTRSISLDMSQKSSTMDDGSRRSSSCNGDVKPTTPLRQKSFHEDSSSYSDNEDDEDTLGGEKMVFPFPPTTFQRAVSGAGVSVTPKGTLMFVARGPPRGPRQQKL